MDPAQIINNNNALEIQLPSAFPDLGKLEAVQDILERNRSLLYEIKANHDMQKPDGLAKNFALIKELNLNIDMLIQTYAEISKDYVNFMQQQRPDSASGPEMEEAVPEADE